LTSLKFDRTKLVKMPEMMLALRLADERVMLVDDRRSEVGITGANWYKSTGTS